MSRKQKISLLRILATGLMLAGLHFAPLSGVARLLTYLIPYLIIGYDILIKAGKGMLNRQVFDENFLMSIATLGAMIIGFIRTGDYTEAIAVMLFYQIGEWFQRYALGKSRRSIRDLMDIRPDFANIEQDERLIQVPAEEVAPGSIIVVQPGEKMPLDGVVEEGQSSLDTSALTGESLPRQAGPGDEIFSGCINLTGVLKIRTTKAFDQSTASRILELVENASARKARSEDFIARFARVYTPIVCLGALLLAVLPPLVRILFLGLNGEFTDWIYRALTFLVISCPCALVISIPLSFFGGIGGASRAGVLVKGANYLEALARTGVMVFDKTGTLTKGIFAVTDIHPVGMEKEALLEYAAHAECASSHPISKSLQKAYGRALERSRVSRIQELSGLGITALVDGKTVAAGNEKLMGQLHIPISQAPGAGAVVHLAVEGDYAGYILISDSLKSTAREAVQALREAGVRKIVMLTGDRKESAEHFASQLQLDQVYSQLLPEDKVEKVEALLQEKRSGETLAFAGDGVNDAPVLSRADIGVAMGAIGSDAAIEAADIVLMDDDPMKISKAIRIARKCMAIVRQNIVFAIGVKLICLAFGALGIARMGLAIFADVGVMILAVLNAMRALTSDKIKIREEAP